MKNLIFTLFCLSPFILLKGQDVGISGSYNPTSIPVMQTSLLTVSWDNYGNAIPVGSVEVTVTFPQTFYDCNATPTGNFMTYFADFNDNDNDGLWTGSNTVIIPAFAPGNGLTLIMEVSGIAIIPSNSSTLFNTAFGLFSGLTDMFPSDNNSDAGIIVTAAIPMPVKLVSFNANTTECDQVDLSWVTASERISDYFEVQRSIDGRQFVALQKLKSANTSDGASYKFSDTDVSGGTRYSYRLKQVDFDGKFELFNPTSVRTAYCSGLDPSMSVYPNPANGKAFIALEGFEVGDNITLEITNNLGEQVMTVENAAVGVPNEILLNTIPAGVYNVRIKGYDQVASKMLIKVN